MRCSDLLLSFIAYSMILMNSCVGLTVDSLSFLGTLPSPAFHVLPVAQLPSISQPHLNPVYQSCVLVAGESVVNSQGSEVSSLLSGLVGGAASRAAKEIILHPIDTIR
jgi:hypothetical protein